MQTDTCSQIRLGCLHLSKQYLLSAAAVGKQIGIWPLMWSLICGVCNVTLEVCGCGASLATQLGQDGCGGLWHHWPKEDGGEPQTLEGKKKNRLKQAVLFYILDQ